MIYTSLRDIRAEGPCKRGWNKLLEHLGKTQADYEPLSFLTILESNGVEDAAWCLRTVGHDAELRKLACDLALSVAHLWDMPPVVREYLETQNEELRMLAHHTATEACRLSANYNVWNAIRATAHATVRDVGDMNIAGVVGDMKAIGTANIANEIFIKWLEETK